MKTNWISVKDRLPPIETQILLCYGCDIYIGYFSNLRFSPMYLSNAEFNQKFVTHWQQLPEPPLEYVDKI